MRLRTGIRWALFLLLASALVAPPALAQAPDFKAQMRKVLDAWETMDPAKVAPYYTQEPGRLFFDLYPLKYAGWNEYAEGVKRGFADFASIKFTLNSDAQAEQRGNTAWSAATVRTDIVTKSGAKESFDARWTVAWEKRGKAWVIAHDHFSATTPAPLDASAPLYKRLGGYDAIAAVVDDFVPRLVGDRQLGRFFVGASLDSQKRIRQLLVDQVCQATGGPCLYIGRSMKAAHEGLNITEADWQAAVNHLVDTLDKFQVPTREKNELLSAVSNLKLDIVAKK